MSHPIRTAEPDDLPALRDLYRRSSLSNDEDRDVLLANPDALVLDESGVHEHRTRVALAGDEIVGFMSTSPNGEVDELEDVFVDPAWMRRGVARELLRDTVERARARGAVRLEVTANGAALEFYAAVGFVHAGTAETRFGPAARMHLDLTA